jgi:hypothetical protein
MKTQLEEEITQLRSLQVLR